MNSRFMFLAQSPQCHRVSSPFFYEPHQLCDDLIEAIEVLQRLWEQSGAKLKLANNNETDMTAEFLNDVQPHINQLVQH